MEIIFELHHRVNWRELDAVAESQKIVLKKSSYFFLPEFVDLGVWGSLASIISLFLYLKEKYDNRVAKNIKIDGKINVETIDELIDYLTSLKEKINATANIPNNTKLIEEEQKGIEEEQKEIEELNSGLQRQTLEKETDTVE